ncbi:MAG: ATP-dependent Clp protease proteolytic subunit [Myxococcales bacterium]|nr:ATP-dependent Clp protease proteolytic subunit [Myxococcales bacterium]
MWRFDDDDDDREDLPGGAESKEAVALASKMLDTRTLIVADEVSDQLYRRIATTMMLLERKDPKAPITVFVNSPGGSADSGFAIYDLFRFSPCPVITVANGVVASAAVLIFLGSPPGKRVSLPNARFLLHQPSTAARGQASDIDITAKEIVKLRRRYNEIVSEATGKDLDQVGKDSDRDFWLTAEESKDYGLVNRIVTSRSELDALIKG